MGYRELLKRYLRHVENCAGETYVETQVPAPVLSPRDLGELRTLAAEIARDSYRGDEAKQLANFNQRLRALMNRHGLTVSEAAGLAGVETETIRRWRTAPQSDRYLIMSGSDFHRFETALTRWLEMEGG
jgi:hypothetical protein